MNMQTHALLVAVSRYDDSGWRSLPATREDVRELEQALLENNVSSVTLYDPTRDEFARALAQFLFAHGQNPHSHLLVYIAGHGYSERTASGEWLGYLALRDTPNPDQKKYGAFLARAFPLQEFEDLSLRIGARHVLFLFDACFSGSIFDRAGPPVPSETDEERRRRELLPVRQFITAGNQYEQVPEGSHFRREIVNLLTGKTREPVWDGYLTGSEIGKHLQERLPRLYPPTNPLYGTIRDTVLSQGDFVLRLNPAFSPPPPDYRVPIVIDTGLEGVTVRVGMDKKGETAPNGQLQTHLPSGSYILECAFENSRRARYYEPYKDNLWVDRHWTTRVVRVELKRRDVGLPPP